MLIKCIIHNCQYPFSLQINKCYKDWLNVFGITIKITLKTHKKRGYKKLFLPE